MKVQYIDKDGVIGNIEDGGINIKQSLFRILHFWPLFAISLLLFFSAAYFYLQYTSPVYKALAAVMVKDEKRGANLMDNAALNELGLSGNNKLVENEIEILKSYDLMEEVVDTLQLFVSIKRAGQIRDISVYGSEVPFSIKILNPTAIKQKRTWTITSKNDSLIFKSSAEKRPIDLEYNEVYEVGGINFICSQNNSAEESLVETNNHAARVFKIRLDPPSESVMRFSERLSVKAVSKVASVIDLEIKDEHKKRATEVLQTLIGIYNHRGLQDKNRVADNTIDFLNARLVSVSAELRGVEGSVERFKSVNRVTDLSANAQLYLASSQQVDAQKAQSQTQLNIVNELERTLANNQDNPQLVPSTLGIQEPSLGVLIEKHNELILQMERMELKSGPKNPLLIDQKNQIKEIRSKLLTNVSNLKQAYTISLNDISQKDAQLNSQIRNVPQLEKKLVQITRNQNVQEQLYAFLLQKREEAAVSRASNIEDSRTVLKARSISVVWPKKKLTWMVAIFLGLVLPAAFIFLKDFFNNKIDDIAEVEQLSKIPLIGIINHTRRLKSPIVVDPGSSSVISEQIRNIRTAIGFKDKKAKSILVTSCEPGDGKSFVSLNLAASFALLDKKTVIVEFDLRRPKIASNLGLSGQQGINEILTTYMSFDNLLLEIPGYNRKLFLLPSGQLPPNPSELISSPKVATLFAKLEERFDYIIFDSPTYGLVTDTSLLQRLTDTTLIVVRQGSTNKEVIDAELMHEKLLDKDHQVMLVVNDVRKKRFQKASKFGSYGHSRKGHYYKQKAISE